MCVLSNNPATSKRIHTIQNWEKKILVYIFTILTNVLLRIQSRIRACLKDKSYINTVSCFTYSTTNCTPSTSPCFGEEPATQSQF